MDTDVSHEVEKRLDELDARVTALEGGSTEEPVVEDVSEDEE